VIAAGFAWQGRQSAIPVQVAAPEPPPIIINNLPPPQPPVADPAEPAAPVTD